MTSPRLFEVQAPDPNLSLDDASKTGLKGRDVKGKPGLLASGKQSHINTKIGSEGSIDYNQPALPGSTRDISPHQIPISSQQNYFSLSPPTCSSDSQIFERDVSILTPISSDQIPPVLDASSEIITNDTLDLDNVEIVSVLPIEQSWTSAWEDELVTHPYMDDLASSYGALDPTNARRRLSFISFSDIQSEVLVGGKDSFHAAGLGSSSSGHDRSTSPMRSPVSSHYSSSPPAGFETIPRGISSRSPVSPHHTSGAGEVTIEAMSQALRRTGSGDLSGHRSQPMSPLLSDTLFELH